MLVIISDLHFEEESSDIIPGVEGNPTVAYTRNLPAKLFRNFISHLASEALRNQAKQLDLVFAGDIFDINRTSLWFRIGNGNQRPYMANDQVDREMEGLILQIMDKIQAENEVQSTLGVFKLLANGLYWNQGEKVFPVPVQLHYVPGNHDRLLNATPQIRRVVRRALSLPNVDETLPHILTFPAEEVVIRHGHEYDRYNFVEDLEQADHIKLHLPDEFYDSSPFGDFATIDIAVRIPHLFRQHHGDEKIRSDAVLRSIYLRLLEFDDLRPQRAMLNFLLSIPGEKVDPITVWRAIEPIFYRLLEELHEDPHLDKWLDMMDKKWRLDSIDLIQTALALKSWRITGIPLGLAQFVSNSVIASRDDVPQVAALAARETVIRNGEYRFLVSGHTHVPAVELIASDRMGERYYVNTGTWRNRIPTTPYFKAFGRLKTLTYAVFYGPGEDSAAQSSAKTVSMDYWSGLTQRWQQIRN